MPFQLNLYKQDSEMAQQFKEFMTDQISNGEDLSKAYCGLREMVAQLDVNKTYGGLVRSVQWFFDFACDCIEALRAEFGHCDIRIHLNTNCSLSWDKIMIWHLDLGCQYTEAQIYLYI